MINIRMVSHNVPDSGPYTLTESFENERQALHWLVGYIGAAPIVIRELEIENG